MKNLVAKATKAKWGPIPCDFSSVQQ